MKKFGLYLLIFLFTFVNFLYILPVKAFACEINNEAKVITPEITEIIQLGNYANKPVVKGKCATGNEVLIYVDGSFVDFAEITSTDGISDFFKLELNKTLEIGEHTIMAVAKDRTSLVLSAPSEEMSFFISPISSPTIVFPNQFSSIGDTRPILTGLTVSGTNVYIYIDGNFVRKIDNVTSPSGTANFYYKPVEPLSLGTHTFSAYSEDVYGRTSEMTEPVSFTIEAPLPAPTLLDPIINKNKITLVGLTKNETTVKVFVDNKIAGETLVKPDRSKTANFSFILGKNLTKGKHLVYTTAIDTKGKESTLSNTKAIVFNQANTPAITKNAVEEKKDTENKSAENDKSINDKNKDQISDDVIKNILSNNGATNTPESGLINENKSQQGKLQTNLIVFILFLLAVIAWIFWVNRELIKEKGGDRKEKESNNKTPNL